MSVTNKHVVRLGTVRHMQSPNNCLTDYAIQARAVVDRHQMWVEYGGRQTLYLVKQRIESTIRVHKILISTYISRNPAIGVNLMVQLLIIEHINQSWQVVLAVVWSQVKKPCFAR